MAIEAVRQIPGSSEVVGLHPEPAAGELAPVLLDVAAPSSEIGPVVPFDGETPVQ